MNETSAGCRRCGDSGWELIRKDGKEFVRPCVCAEDRRRRSLLEAAALPALYRKCSLENFEVWNSDDPTLGRALRKVREFVDLWPEAEKGLLLMGPVGTGKTHLAAGALQSLILSKGVEGRFVDFTSLVLDIQMTFDQKGAQRELMRPLVETRLLVLDELGAGKVTPWIMDLLYYLVNTRYVEDRKTIITTNYSDFASSTAEKLEDRVSARIRSRLYEMCTPVELRGGDYRKERRAR